MKLFGKDARWQFARSAEEIKRYRIRMRILPVILIFAVTLTSVIYVVAALYDKYGSFTVSVNKLDNVKYSLSLCEERNFKNRTSRLNAKASEEITNIRKQDLPEDLDMIDGLHSGLNHVAYTFYLRNVGNTAVTYEYLIYIVNVTQELDRAVRVRLYVDGVPTDYARTRTDGEGAEPETTEFISLTTVCRRQVEDFRVGDTTKFTVVIWLEGTDPDCTNDKLGGTFKIDMAISIDKVDTDGDGIVDSTVAQST